MFNAVKGFLSFNTHISGESTGRWTAGRSHTAG